MDHTFGVILHCVSPLLGQTSREFICCCCYLTKDFSELVLGRTVCVLQCRCMWGFTTTLHFQHFLHLCNAISVRQTYTNSNVRKFHRLGIFGPQCGPVHYKNNTSDPNNKYFWTEIKSTVPKVYSRKSLPQTLPNVFALIYLHALMNCNGHSICCTQFSGVSSEF